jgi:ornithine decarboxylase
VAIQQARDVFDLGLQMGFNMTLLDIGGGFPGQESAAISFGEIATVVNMALDKYFPAEEGVDIISEPGRYFVASAYTVAVNIIAKRVVARDQHGENGELLDHPSASDEPSIMYYVNDGVYGSFNCLLYDHASVTVNSLKDVEDYDDDEIRYESSVWGPTCDGLDCILESVPLQEHSVGDWLYFQDMGAYTMAAASTFNGMPAPSRHYYCQADLWQEVYPEGVAKPSRPRPLPMVPLMKTGHRLQEASCCDFLSTSAPESLVATGLPELVDN